MTLIRRIKIEVERKPLEWRKGQTAFNTLYALEPDMANLIRGNRYIDPFYNDGNLRTFYKWLEDGAHDPND